MSAPALRVLFVDDEAAVLEGLENRLRPLRDKWQMRFARGAAEAWAVLERESCDVIVCDMRMPGMDGAEMLRHVRERYPQMARMILSGQTSRDGMLRALPVAHQFLAKPCDAQTLEQAVERACALQGRLQAPAVKRAIGALRIVPALPRLYWDVAREVESPRATSASIAAIVQQDPGMTARLLQVANSAFFGIARRIAHARDAVTFLGVEPVRSLVLSEQMFRGMSDLVGPTGFSLERLQRHSLAVAQRASQLLEGGELARSAFSAGVLHDLGQLVIAVGLPEAYAEIRQRSALDGAPTFVSEQTVLGCSHAEIGAQMLALWGLPPDLVEAVACHHAPRLAQETVFGVTGAVHVADALAEGPQQAASDTLDLDYLREVGMLERLPQWRASGAGLAA